MYVKDNYSTPSPSTTGGTPSQVGLGIIRAKVGQVIRDRMTGSGSGDRAPIPDSEGKAVETPFKSRVNLMHIFGSPPPAKEVEERPDSSVSSDKLEEPSKRVNNLFGPINMKCLLCCDSALMDQEEMAAHLAKEHSLAGDGKPKVSRGL